ncbi:hypothetical protein Hanom_Chr11g01037961 [Helianthus anomalus]
MELAQGGAGRCGQMDRDYLLNTYDVSNINTYDWVFTLMLPLHLLTLVLINTLRIDG